MAIFNHAIYSNTYQLLFDMPNNAIFVVANRMDRFEMLKHRMYASESRLVSLDSSANDSNDDQTLFSVHNYDHDQCFVFDRVLPSFRSVSNEAESMVCLVCHSTEVDEGVVDDDDLLYW